MVNGPVYVALGAVPSVLYRIVEFAVELASENCVTCAVCKGLAGLSTGSETSASLHVTKSNSPRSRAPLPGANCVCAEQANNEPQKRTGNCSDSRPAKAAHGHFVREPRLGSVVWPTATRLGQTAAKTRRATRPHLRGGETAPYPHLPQQLAVLSTGAT
jgi:hypothetical protein